MYNILYIILSDAVAIGQARSAKQNNKRNHEIIKWDRRELEQQLQNRRDHERYENQTRHIYSSGLTSKRDASTNLS
jgi:hypothetical protein